MMRIRIRIHITGIMYIGFANVIQLGVRRAKRECKVADSDLAGYLTAGYQAIFLSGNGYLVKYMNFSWRRRQIVQLKKCWEIIQFSLKVYIHLYPYSTLLYFANSLYKIC